MWLPFGKSYENKWENSNDSRREKRMMDSKGFDLLKLRPRT
jgi:hypothetical protein